MRCKKHSSDISSTVGVCATCLRERLFALVAAHSQAHQQLCNRTEDRPRVLPDPNPPPLVFPRSVSPYVSRRKSDGATWSDDRRLEPPRHQRFYSTPQVGPTYYEGANSVTFTTAGSSRRKQKNKFSLWSSLFRSRSDKFVSDCMIISGDSCARTSASTTSSSWFSSMFSGRRETQAGPFSHEHAVATGGRRRCRRINRGMSPTRDSDSECDADACKKSPSAAGYLSESSQKWRRSPAVAAGSGWRGRPVHNRNVSGITFCLSPLVRASPNRHRNQKGFPSDTTFPGDVSISGMPPPHISTAASFCANRSRKIADFGRVNTNR